jgi:ribosomal protein L11 methyltransferase
MSSASFLEVSFLLGGFAAEAAEAVCFACGASSVTFTDSRDDPVLEPGVGEIRMWPATRVHALFAAGTPEVAGMVAAGLGIDVSDIEMREVEDRAWEREWLKDFHALRFGKRLWVCPHHEEVSEAGAVVVKLDPGLAFGTGTHPSTALCLEWLDTHVRVGARVVDYGCGSGILALAAVKLGAERAWCFDIDPQALIATRDNAVANGVADRVRRCASAEELPREADIVVANILSGPLCELAPRLAGLARPGGALVLAGLMEHEAAEVTAAYSAWSDMKPFGKRDDWIALSGLRK